MTFGGGTTDLVGEISVLSGGSIVTSNSGVTTIHNDLIHEGTEIRTEAGSTTVVRGTATGSGAYTGAGTVVFAGGLLPGSSPAIVLFGGSVVLDATAQMVIELFGKNSGEYDQLSIAGNLDLDGTLAVELGPNFVLGHNQEFLIAEVGGNLSGTFDNLGEGGLVGNFQGVDLFISYSPGGGNGIMLYSAVPEPGGLGLMCVLMGLICSRRRRLS